jgi:hypothetical protein
MFSYVQEDLDALVNATGLSEMEVIAHEELGREYSERLRLQHAMGQNGALSIDGRVNLIRSLGMSAPPRPVVKQETDWRMVNVSTRVIVTPDLAKPEKRQLGTYKGLIEAGVLEILLDGSISGTDEFRKEQVVIAPSGLPEGFAGVASDYVQPEPEVAVEFDDPLEAVQLEAETVRGDVDRTDPEGRVHNPVMAQDWTEIDAGMQVGYRIKNKVHVAEFIDVGPTDGCVSLRFNDQTVVVSEEFVSQTPPEPKPVKPATRKRRTAVKK